MHQHELSDTKSSELAALVFHHCSLSCWLGLWFRSRRRAENCRFCGFLVGIALWQRSLCGLAACLCQCVPEHTMWHGLHCPVIDRCILELDECVSYWELAHSGW